MKAKLLALVLFLQTAVIAGLSIWHELGLSSGHEVLLETVPVDPRDLLRGDYLILRYAISSIPRDKFDEELPDPVPAGDPIFATLTSTGEFHEIVRASRQPLTTIAGEILIIGSVQRQSGGDVPVEYGMEQFYVREGTGNPDRAKKLTVLAAIARSGKARIKEVYLDGTPYAEAMGSVAK